MSVEGVKCRSWAPFSETAFNSKRNRFQGEFDNFDDDSSTRAQWVRFSDNGENYLGKVTGSNINAPLQLDGFGIFLKTSEKSCFRKGTAEVPCSPDSFVKPLTKTSKDIVEGQKCSPTGFGVGLSSLLPPAPPLHSHSTPPAPPCPVDVVPRVLPPKHHMTTTTTTTTTCVERPTSEGESMDAVLRDEQKPPKESRSTSEGRSIEDQPQKESPTFFWHLTEKKSIDALREKLSRSDRVSSSRSASIDDASSPLETTKSKAKVAIIILGEKLLASGDPSEILLQRSRAAASLQKACLPQNVVFIASGADVAGIGSPDKTEARVILKTLKDEGVVRRVFGSKEGVLMYEEKSSGNTIENAFFVKKMLRTTPALTDIETVILVTSDFHLPRSVVFFQCMLADMNIQLLAVPSESGPEDAVLRIPEEIEYLLEFDRMVEEFRHLKNIPHSDGLLKSVEMPTDEQRTRAVSQLHALQQRLTPKLLGLDAVEAHEVAADATPEELCEEVKSLTLCGDNRKSRE